MSSSNVLANRRKELNLSQSKIADELGYSVQTISKWETGKSFPDLPIWGELAKVLQIDLDALINDELKSNYNNVCCYNTFSADKFSSNLRKQRKIRDMTQKELAEKLGISYQTLLAWEKGTTFPNVEQFKIISNELNISYDNLYFADDSLTPYELEKIREERKIEKSIRKRKLFSTLTISLFAIISIFSISISAILLNDKFGNDHIAFLPSIESDNSLSSDSTSFDPLDPMNELVNLPCADYVRLEHPFYDSNSSAEERMKAIVCVGDDVYVKSLGHDYSSIEQFDIYASFSGQVIKIESQELRGNVIWIKHISGVVAEYSSILIDQSLEVGQEVKQGDIIGMSGASNYTQELGNNTLHFQMGIDEMFSRSINPKTAFGKLVVESKEFYY